MSPSAGLTGGVMAHVEVLASPNEQGVELGVSDGLGGRAAIELEDATTDQEGLDLGKADLLISMF